MNEYERKVLAEAEEIRHRYLNNDAIGRVPAGLGAGLGGELTGQLKYVSPARLTNQEITDHHSPGPEQIQRITTIRAAARNFLDAIDANCPGCADRTSARRKVREAMMLANASIALNGAV